VGTVGSDTSVAAASLIRSIAKSIWNATMP
jgi:hypothetical protein